MAYIHYRISVAASIGLSAMGVAAIFFGLIQWAFLMIGRPDAMAQAAGVNAWLTVQALGSWIVVGLALIVAGGVGRAIIALAPSNKAG